MILAELRSAKITQTTDEPRSFYKFQLENNYFMKAELYGTCSNPAVVVIGSWDPFISAHRQLMDQLSQYARSCSLTSAAMLLHPNPSSFLHGFKAWPVYDDILARVTRIRSCSVDAVLVIRFTKRDVDRGAIELFDLIDLHLKINELWLGPSQSLGPGPGGSSATIELLAGQRNIHLERLTQSDTIKDSYHARQSLVDGCLQKAIQIAGHPPVWKRPKSGRIQFPWPAGNYTAVPMDSPTGAADAPPLCVSVSPKNNGFSELLWPDKSIEWLAFIKGPGDE